MHAIAAWPKDPRVLAAGTAQGVWVSEDSWPEVAPHLEAVAARNAGDHGGRVRLQRPGDDLCGTPHLPWKTGYGGETWESIHEGLIDDTDVFSIYVDRSRPERVLLSACSGIYQQYQN